MSEVISIVSSDDEQGSLEPPRKRVKSNAMLSKDVGQETFKSSKTIIEQTPVLAECTLTLIKKPKNKKNNKADIVELDDSDEDANVTNFKKNTDTVTNSIVLDQISTNIENGLDVVNKLDPVKALSSISESISLIDDDDDVITEKSISASRNKNDEDASNGSTKDDLDNTNIIHNVNSMKSVSILDASEDETEDKEKIDDKSIVIHETSSEDEKEKENSCINVQKESNCVSLSPSEKLVATKKLFQKFLTVVESAVVGSQFEEIIPKKIPIIQKYFKRCGVNIEKSSSFNTILEENIKKAENSAANAVICFHAVYENVKVLVDTFTVEIEDEHILKVKKLDKTIKLLLAKIHQLENAEVDFDQEEDSTYMQLERYINRLQKVHKKYCQYIKKKPYSGRITFDKIDFIDSSYNEINLAINKKYRNSLKFPSYYEIHNFITKVAKDENLGLSESMIRVESEKCFKKLGKILQKRRKTELYDAHRAYIEESEDPAEKDNMLADQLRKNAVEGEIKIEKVCEKYVTKQELGEEAELSEEESSASYYKDSEVGEEENE